MKISFSSCNSYNKQISGNLKFFFEKQNYKTIKRKTCLDYNQRNL